MLESFNRLAFGQRITLLLILLFSILTPTFYLVTNQPVDVRSRAEMSDIPPHFTSQISQTPQASRVFVTSLSYNGNLGGLAGADAKCQERANAANLGGVWKAWLSDNTTSATRRLYHYNGNYTLVDGSIQFTWDILQSDHPFGGSIYLNEFGSPTYGMVWTNTKTDGTIASVNTGYSNGGHCYNWRSSTASLLGVKGNNSYNIGNPTKPNAWTWDGSQSCSQNASLYCFEQIQNPAITPTLSPTPTPTQTPTPTPRFKITPIYGGTIVPSPTLPKPGYPY